MDLLLSLRWNIHWNSRAVFLQRCSKSGLQRYIIGPLGRPTVSELGSLCLCRIPRKFWHILTLEHLQECLGSLWKKSLPVQTNSEFSFQLDLLVTSIVLSCLCIWLCVWFCNSLETCESLQNASPTCYHSIIVFGFVVVTKDADVTKTLASVLQTNVKHGQP